MSIINTGQFTDPWSDRFIHGRWDSVNWPVAPRTDILRELTRTSHPRICSCCQYSSMSLSILKVFLSLVCAIFCFHLWCMLRPLPLTNTPQFWSSATLAFARSVFEYHVSRYNGIEVIYSSVFANPINACSTQPMTKSSYRQWIKPVRPVYAKGGF